MSIAINKSKCVKCRRCIEVCPGNLIKADADGNIIMVDDDRFKFREGEKPEMKKVRFRTLGCYPLTGGVESDAETLDEIIDETLAAVSSERTSRVIDNEAAGSMERRKREGYF